MIRRRKVETRRRTFGVAPTPTRTLDVDEDEPPPPVGRRRDVMVKKLVGL